MKAPRQHFALGRLRWSPSFLLFSLFTCTFSSCGNQTEDASQGRQGTTTASADESNTLRIDSSGLPTWSTDELRDFFGRSEKDPALRILTDKPEVRLPELQRVESDFNEWFHSDRSGQFEPLSSTEVEVLWEDVDSICRNLIGTNGVIRGLVFHYGYDRANRAFKVGLSRVPMTYNAATADYDYDTTRRTFYTVDQTGRLIRSSLSAWNNGEKRDYFQFVHHQRAGADRWNPVNTSDDDAESYAMAYDMEIKLLGEHNRAHIKPDTKFVVSCIAEQARDGEGSCQWRHHLAVKLRNGNQDLVDDKPHGSLFEKRAADLGTPCPPRCKKFKFGDKSRLCLP